MDKKVELLTQLNQNTEMKVKEILKIREELSISKAKLRNFE